MVEEQDEHQVEDQEPAIQARDACQRLGQLAVPPEPVGKGGHDQRYGHQREQGDEGSRHGGPSLGPVPRPVTYRYSIVSNIDMSSSSGSADLPADGQDR